MSKPHIYEVAKGNEVRAEFVGREVPLTRATTVEEAIALGHYENVEALVSAAEQQWLIGARAAIRTELGKETGTLESASAAGNSVKLGAPRERAEPKPKTPKAQAVAAAKNAGSKLFDRMNADAQYEARIRKLDPEMAAEFDAWKVAVAAGSATPATAQG